MENKEKAPKKRRSRLWVWIPLLIIIVSPIILVFNLDFSKSTPPVLGVTFSAKYAEELQTDWREMYLAILDDLEVDHLRLVAYWDEIEAERDEFDYADLDWQVEQATDRGAQIVLSVGRRMPRWPECHDPKWIEPLAPAVIESELFDFVGRTVERYSDNENIIAWQIENEPLFKWFGECPEIRDGALRREVLIARELDDRPIILTDSGELNHWQGVGGLADKVGITMYRIVWNPFIGFWDYFFIPPAAYRWKADFTLALNPALNDVIITELQMEPWTTGRSMIELTLEEQRESFDLHRFKSNVAYAQRAGFSEIYMWGVEYWYWLAQQGYPELWDEAKKLW